MASWVASSKVSFASVWPYSPALILSSAVQNQPGKPWLPITCAGIGGSASVTRSSLSEAPTLGNAGPERLDGPRAARTGVGNVLDRARIRPSAGCRNGLDKAAPGARYDMSSLHATALLG